MHNKRHCDTFNVIYHNFIIVLQYIIIAGLHIPHILSRRIHGKLLNHSRGL